MATTSKLTEFPAEMIAAVGTLVDNSGIFSLRAVCRKWNLAVDDHFLKVFFTKRTHLYTDCSLEALRSISFEDRIAKNIQDIHVICEEVLLPQIARMADTLLEEVLNNLARRNQSIKLTLLNGSFVSIWSSFVPEIIEPYRSIASMRCYARHDVQGDWIEHEQKAAESWHTITERLLSFAAKTKIIVTSLDLGFHGCGRGMVAKDYQLDVDNVSMLLAPFANLTRLKLGLDSSEEHLLKDWRLIDSKGTGIGLKDVFRVAIGLQELSLAFIPLHVPSLGSYEYRLEFEQLKPYIEGLKLRKLELANLWFDGGDLLNLISIFKGRLQHLILSRLLLDSRNEWACVIELMAKLPSLRQVDMFHLVAGIEESVLAEEAITLLDDSVDALLGENSIPTVLQKMADNLRR